MKLTIVGGGGFRVPLVYGALLAKRERLPFDEVVLHDLDAERMERMGGVLRGLAARARRASCRSARPPTSTTRSRAPTSCSPRSASGGSRAAWSTSRVPLALGVLGQETTGPGGICFALRTIPAMVELAETIAERAPQRLADQLHQPGRDGHRGASSRCSATAWSGSATRPRGLCRRVARALGLRAARRCGSTTSASTTSAGSRARHDAERDRLPELLADDDALGGFEEGRLFGGDWLRALGMIPNEYLYYFYEDAVAHDGREPARRLPARVAGRVLRAERPGRPPRRSRAWRATRAERDRTYMAAERLAAGVEADHDDGGDGGGYEGEAMAVVEAIANNTRAIMILNTANRSALPFLDERAVVEVPVHRRPHRPGAGRGRAGPRARPGARDHDQGRRADDDRGRAQRLAASWPSARSRCTRWCRASPPRARSSTATAAALPELRGALRA